MALQSLGKYTLTKPLEPDGPVKVYQALDLEANRAVIIKLLPPNPQLGANPRFFQEFQAKVTSLRHPYLARVYEVGLINDSPFLVMEDVQGRPLSDDIAPHQARQEATPLATVAWKLGLIAAALDYAHSQGVVHGNLNPTNILLTDVDEPILTDFGLVRLLPTDPASFGLRLPAYTAPEQASGQPGDRLSDLYALGMILYGLVTGRPPLEADSPDAILDPPLSFKADLPEAAQAVILRALAKEPGRRFASAHELSGAFASALAETPAEPSGAGRPQAIGRYRFEAELGRRDNLVVYRAYDVELERQVAIKILLPQFVTNNEVRLKFQREVELLSTLDHHAVVEVYDFGEYEGRPYVVMPYLAGGTLETRLQAGPLDLQTLTPIMERVAAALDEAHARHLIHARLLPSNILFDSQGQAYLSDFSSPAPFDTWTAFSRQENAAKEVNYMSPEQLGALLEERGASLDGRSDIYSLGVILFEALTGQRPYQAETAYETALAHLNAPIPLLHKVKPDLPETYQTLINRTLAKEPAGRYATAGAVPNHMKELLAGRWYMGKISGLVNMRGASAREPVELSSPASPQARLFSSSTFGRYQLGRELGRGGMGAVYLAYDPETKRQVALKLLLDHLVATPGFREQFQREARLIAMLKHDYIAPIYDFGDYKGQPFIVIPYLSGGTLAHKLAQGRLKSNQLTSIIRRVALALDEAHRQNIIHQDVKPGNVLFNDKGEAFLADFGIAVLQVSDLGAEGRLGGTPHYMSPEQIKVMMKKEGREKLDGRSDLYSLGVVLFEMLTGRVPYPAGTPREIALAHLTQPVPRLREIKPDLLAAYQQVIDRALAKDPAQRYQTGEALAKDLQELAGGRWYLRQLIE